MRDSHGGCHISELTDYGVPSLGSLITDEVLIG